MQTIAAKFWDRSRKECKEVPILGGHFHGHRPEEKHLIGACHRVIEFEGQFELTHVEFSVD